MVSVLVRCLVGFLVGFLVSLLVRFFVLRLPVPLVLRGLSLPLLFGPLRPVVRPFLVVPRLRLPVHGPV